LNPTIFSFSTDGVITTPPRTRAKYLLAANANNIGNSKISIGLNSFAYTLQSDSNSNAIASLPIDLPIGVEITELSVGVSDFSQNSSVSVVLMEHAFGTTTALEVYSLETTLADSSGHRVLNSTLSTPITIQEGMTYYLEIRLLGSLTNFAEFIDAKISYTTDQLD